jgi:hypothetical protein
MATYGGPSRAVVIHPFGATRGEEFLPPLDAHELVTYTTLERPACMARPPRACQGRGPRHDR